MFNVGVPVPMEVHVRIRRFGVIAGVVLAVLAGCTDGDGTASTVAGSAAPLAAASTTAPAAASAAPTATRPAAPSSAAPGVPGAIDRFEQFLHALGRADVATMCEIAGPAAKRAEREGFGPCEQTMPIVSAMMSAAQKTALLSATVDPARVTVPAADRVVIPARAVRASVVFTARDLGDSVMEHIDGAWYVTD